jgi:hypothetical protein
VSAPETLCRELRRLRNDGLTFNDAWAQALEIAIRVDCNAGDWLHIFNATREGWQRGYENRPAERQEDAALALAYDELGPLEHEDVDNPTRTCPQCGRELPKTAPAGRRKGRNAVYCTRECQRAANGRSAAVELIA